MRPFGTIIAVLCIAVLLLVAGVMLGWNLFIFGISAGVLLVALGAGYLGMALFKKSRK